jgi:sulfite exporter TauE/SafE/plastocyanin domain-containing protein
VGTLIIIFALYMALRRFGGNGLAGMFPLAEAGMGYGMLFVIGLVTSVHCLAMCGGINLSQTITAVPSGGGALRTALRPVLRPALLYNGGRVVSYTVTGAVVGALGRVISFTGGMKGVVQIAAGVFMVIMGINMLGIFPWLRRLNPHLPRFFARKLEKERDRRSPLFVGLLNGLMPCGPLQAMQLYALSTGDPVRGALSMLIFSLGTTPLMFALGALGSLLSSKFAARVMRAGAVLVVVLGMIMFSNGWGLSGFSFDFLPRLAGAAPSAGGDFTPVLENGVQIVRTTLSSGRYQPITVQSGIPVRWTIDAPPGSISGCNNRMLIREYGIEHSFTYGENVIEFTPSRTGRFTYSCWMGMIRSSITVVEPGGSVAEGDADGGYGGFIPESAGYAIPVERVAVAELSDTIQEVRITLTDDGFDPAIVVLQAGIPATWTINNTSPDEGSASLLFPAYVTELPVELGDNRIYLIPSADFDFSTADSIFYGYVKVVADLGSADIGAIQGEVADYETLIWPPEYFEAGRRCH